MKTSEEIRRENLLALIKEAGSEKALAARYGCTEAHIKTMARGYADSKSGTPKGIGGSSARQLERCMNKERGWLDHDHSRGAVAAEPPPAVSSEDMTLLDALKKLRPTRQDLWRAQILDEAAQVDHPPADPPEKEANPLGRAGKAKTSPGRA